MNYEHADLFNVTDVLYYVFLSAVDVPVDCLWVKDLCEEPESEPEGIGPFVEEVSAWLTATRYSQLRQMKNSKTRTVIALTRFVENKRLGKWDEATKTFIVTHAILPNNDVRVEPMRFKRRIKLLRENEMGHICGKKDKNLIICQKTRPLDDVTFVREGLIAIISSTSEKTTRDVMRMCRTALKNVRPDPIKLAAKKAANAARIQKERCEDAYAETVSASAGIMRCFSRHF